MAAGIVTSDIFEPYAKALMSLARENDLSDRIGEDAATVIEAIENAQELAQLLDSPLVEDDKKKAVLRSIFSEALHHYSLNFLLLLVDRGRAVFAKGIFEQYQALLREIKGIVLAEVVSAVALSDEQANEVRQRVLAMTGANDAELKTSVDGDLLGGVIIKVGSQVIDASLRSQIRRLSLQLTSAAG